MKSLFISLFFLTISSAKTSELEAQNAQDFCDIRFVILYQMADLDGIVKFCDEQQSQAKDTYLEQKTQNLETYNNFLALNTQFADTKCWTPTTSMLGICPFVDESLCADEFAQAKKQYCK